MSKSKIDASTHYKSINLNKRQLCDLELLLNGGFYPLKGFLRENDYNSVVNDCHLNDGQLWAMPITLSIGKENMELVNGINLTLKDEQNIPLAICKNIEIYEPDLDKECKLVYGTNDTNHPYVDIIMKNKNVYYIGGELERIQLPLHYDFIDYRLSPDDLKYFFKENTWHRVIGFQTRNPMHKSHMELTLNALKEINNSKLLLHPIVGITQDCDVDYHTRVRCYQKLLKYYPENSVKLALLPLSMRMAGPREALWHAQIRYNYGCTHFIVGRDHAGPSYKDKFGNNFYGPYDAQQFVKKYEGELQIKIINSQSIVYVKELEEYMEENNVPNNLTIMSLSGTEQRNMLIKSIDIPEWYSYPEIIVELRKSYIPLHKSGFCIYFIGLSGSGKTTMANALYSKLMEYETKRKITILDGDSIRLNLSKGLGFSKNDRSINVQRIGYVASEIVKHNGICICANIAPYDNDRLINRKQIRQYGKYLEIYVGTPLEICESRDVKGLYKMARDGILKEFTGISDPFEMPTKSDLVINGGDDIMKNIGLIMEIIRNEKLIKI